MPTHKPSPALTTIPVWDWTVRLSHWLLALAFLTAYLTAESEAWRGVHMGSGMVALAAALYRVVWGFVGSRHARFSSFVRPPRLALAYLRSLWGGAPQHHTGHNPAGGWAVVALLALVLLSAASGLAMDRELGGRWLEEVHEVLAQLALSMVGLHLLAVALSSWLHRENLVRAMFNGRKLGWPEQAIRPAAGVLGAIALLLWVVGFYVVLR